MGKNVRAFFIVCFLVSAFYFSQHLTGQRRSRMAPYRKSTFTSIRGKIIKIQTLFNRFKKEKGLHLVIKTSREKYVVHVCPQWWASKKRFNFRKGEKLTVSGSVFKRHGMKNMYAATIIRRHSSRPIKLRNPDTGEGLWWGRYR